MYFIASSLANFVVHKSDVAGVLCNSELKHWPGIDTRINLWK